MKKIGLTLKDFFYCDGSSNTAMEWKIIIKSNIMRTLRINIFNVYILYNADMTDILIQC